MAARKQGGGSGFNSGSEDAEGAVGGEVADDAEGAVGGEVADYAVGAEDGTTRQSSGTENNQKYLENQRQPV